MEPQFQWGGLFCTESRKRELFGSSACNHDYEGHPLLVRKSGDWDSHSTFFGHRLIFGQLSQENFGITLLVMKRLKESGRYGMAGTQIHCQGLKHLMEMISVAE